MPTGKGNASDRRDDHENRPRGREDADTSTPEDVLDDEDLLDDDEDLDEELDLDDFDVVGLDDEEGEVESDDIE